ncbi:MAG TPA: FAD-linked oxidase C-terminal domain-containing protein, partial [Pyrinomonadaceae bacterium]
LIELDGIEAGLDEEAAQVTTICMNYGARDCRHARDENERRKLWAARKGAFGAIGRIAPDSMIQDAVVPRSQLPAVLADVYRIAAKYQLRIANVFHAGDGNLHPLICFDSRVPEEVQRVKDAGRELMQTCVRAGGSITGEHGVGLDKRELLPLIFSEKDMETMLQVRAAFDPSGLMNPGKIIPVLRGCGEARAVLGAQAPRPESQTEASQNGKANFTEKQAAFDSSLAAWASSPQPPKNVGVSNKRFDQAEAHQRLANLLGQGSVSLSENFPSALIVTPETIAEICEVMQLASSDRWTVTPAGAMTWLNPERPETNLIVSTRRLNRIIEHEPADLVAITEAGVTLQDFNAHLSLNGQWLPLDTPDDGTATVGGVVATGVGGAQQFGYGPPRRHVIGMKVVMADGSLVNAGGRVVKNVAGYDLCKLFVGSHGTLGIIAQINFKLRPLPSATQTLLLEGDAAQLIIKAEHIMRAQLFPVALELLAPAVGSVVPQLSLDNKFVLMVRFAGSGQAVAAQIAAAQHLFEDNSRVVRDDQSIWIALAALATNLQARVIWRTGLRPTEVAAFVKELIERSGPGLIWHAGLADGRVRVVHDSDTPADELTSLFNTFAAKAHSLGGDLIIENATPAIRESVVMTEPRSERI